MRTDRKKYFFFVYGSSIILPTVVYKPESRCRWGWEMIRSWPTCSFYCAFGPPFRLRRAGYKNVFSLELDDITYLTDWTCFLSSLARNQKQPDVFITVLFNLMAFYIQNKAIFCDYKCHYRLFSLEESVSCLVTFSICSELFGRYFQWSC